jgi:NADH-quinone oxidoreductase subunit E
MPEAVVHPPDIERIIDRYQAKPTALIMVLQEVQQRYHYLPRPALELIGARLDLALSQIHGVATFYRAFSLEPRGRHHVCVCTGTACHVRNSRSIVEKLERDLGVGRGKTTGDGAVTLDTVNCVGCCALGPVATVDGAYWGNLTVSDVDRLLHAVRAADREAAEPVS